MADGQSRFPWHAGHGLAFAQPVLWEEPYQGGWPDGEEAR